MNFWWPGAESNQPENPLFMRLFILALSTFCVFFRIGKRQPQATHLRCPKNQALLSLARPRERGCTSTWSVATRHHHGCGGRSGYAPLGPIPAQLAQSGKDTGRLWGVTSSASLRMPRATAKSVELSVERATGLCAKPAVVRAILLDEVSPAHAGVANSA